MVINALNLQEIRALPFEFKRIIIIDKNNVIIKVIDLISDFHEPLHELVKNPSRNQQAYLSKEEKGAFTTAERTLLITLRKLAKQGAPIQLLWEHEPYSTWKLKTINDPVIHWMLYGNELESEFSVDKGKSIVFNNGDTYRLEVKGLLYLSPDAFSISMLQQEDLLDVPLKEFFKFDELKALLGTVSEATKDLKDVKASVFKNYYKTLSDLWLVYTKEKIQPLYRYLNKMFLQNPNITIGEARDIMSKNKEEEKVSKMIVSFLDIADIEFLIKIFAQFYKHTIVYAGGDHCRAVAQLLVDKFGGSEVIDLGTDKAFRIDSRVTDQEASFIPVLSPRTWFYLAENPQKSLKRFKANRKPFINLADDNIWNSFINLRDLIDDFQPSTKEENELFDQEALKKLEDFYKKSSKTFIDFINVRDGSMKTLLFYAVEKSLPETTAFLLKHNARMNIQDVEGNTPLHYAKTSDITKFLLEWGASMKIKNRKGKTALQQATEQNNQGFLFAVDLLKARKVK